MHLGRWAAGFPGSKEYRKLRGLETARASDASDALPAFHERFFSERTMHLRLGQLYAELDQDIEALGFGEIFDDI